MKKIFKCLLLISGIWVGLSACRKGSSGPGTPGGTQNATLNMHLKDAPADYDAVWLNVQRVEVTMEGHSAIEIIPFRPGMYDILRFRNGLDTLLLRGEVPAGRIGQIRLILGDGNKVVVNGVEEPLTTPSAQESGLKLNINETFVAGGAYDIWLDFDASRSIHQTGSGKYMLKPVIRAYSTATDGRIKGYVLPGVAMTTVYADNGTDVYGAIVAPDGYFIITGLPQGNYQVTYDAAVASFFDVTIPNVSVVYGTTVDLGNTVLIQ